jgi:TonB-linked SusC/RagA family outer membrane protein
MDAKGELLIGVNVTAANDPSNGVITDLNGTYNIQVAPTTKALKFQYVGYKTKTVTIGGSNILDVAMDEDVKVLDQVVVVGYGTQKKASVVGSITNIAPSRLDLSPSRSLSNNLQGQIAGVISVTRSGNPWSNNSDFWIRGISSFTGNTSPLVLVDGIERSLNDIDPDEVASFSVLKDAAASAVYGVRGANGVIMIETKRGKIGKPQVNVRFEQAFTQPTKIPEYVGSYKYLSTLNEMYADEGKSPLYSEATLLNYKNHTDPELYPDTHWWDLMTKDHAENTTATVDVNGGSDLLRYSLVAGYYNEHGLLERDKNIAWDPSLKVSRYTVRSNVDINITPTTLFRVNIGGFLQTKNAPPDNVDNTDAFYQAMRIPPYIMPAIYADGRIPNVQYKFNPWARITQRGFERTNNSTIQSLVSLEQDLKFITPGLKIKGTFSFDKFSSGSVVRSKDPDYYTPASGRDPVTGELVTSLQSQGQQFLGNKNSGQYGNQALYFEGVLSYQRTFARLHEVSGMLMFNRRNYDDGSALPFRTQGFAGRASYTYNGRYIAEFNFGYNGSENFAPGHRYGFFPAVALGWVATQEKFMQPLTKVLSNLKIRASIGEAGNSNINGRRFAYISTIADTNNWVFGTDHNFYRLGRSEGDIGVPNLTWETVTKMNVGADLGFWNNAINLTVDLFKEKRRNIFMQRTNVAGFAGFNNAVWANFGKVNNQGVDMSLQMNKQINADWNISVMANYTYAHNTIIEKDEPAAVVGTYRAETGHPVNQIFGLIADGLFTADDFNADGTPKADLPVQNYSDWNSLRPGDIKYKDLNGDGQITDLDKTAIGGTPDPQVVYGFGATVRWRSIDFGFFFSGVGKTWKMLGGETWLPASSIGAGQIMANIDDRWTVDNPSQNVFWPRMGELSIDNNNQASTWWLRDMSFLRLKNLEVGWTMPELWTKKFGVKNLRFFARGSNLLTFSGFKLWDPEVNTTDGLIYPTTKSLSVGLTINFNN